MFWAQWMFRKQPLLFSLSNWLFSLSLSLSLSLSIYIYIYIYIYILKGELTFLRPFLLSPVCLGSTILKPFAWQNGKWYLYLLYSFLILCGELTFFRYLGWQKGIWILCLLFFFLLFCTIRHLPFLVPGILSSCIILISFSLLK